MSIGFRKSLFGFNCTDVVEYIESILNSFNNKEKSLNEKINIISKELETLKGENKELSEKNSNLETELSGFRTKTQEIERLSENIGKLYLVAQTNAKAIMDSAVDNSRLANAEIQNNFNTIANAHDSLKALREEITKTSENFTAEVDRLISSSADTKSVFDNNNVLSEEAKEDFEIVYKSISE